MADLDEIVENEDIYIYIYTNVSGLIGSFSMIHTFNFDGSY